MSVSIAAIGMDDSLKIYASVGIKVVIVNDVSEVDKKIFSLSKDGCKIIYVTDHIYKNISEVLEKYAYKAYPIILPLPLDNKNEGIGMKKIEANVEKAIGINIFG
ncbi:MAG: V-type ATP synthase subunit F [Bacilli bacterium]|nr:V-type ATP synthase subunit F [Bacilli bacterium]